MAGSLWDRHACPGTKKNRGRRPRVPALRLCQGSAPPHPSLLRETVGEASLLIAGTNFFSALLSVIEESARECEDAVNLLLQFCESFSFVVETLVRKACLGEAELSRTYKVRGVGCLKSLRYF